MKKKILMFSGDMAGCCHYRLILPTIALNSTGKYISDVSGIIDQEKYEFDPDVIVFSRQHKEQVQVHMKVWKQQKKRIVYDVDDNVFAIPMSNPAYSVFKKIKNELLSAIKLADVLTVSTEPLKEAYSKYHNNIKVLPNQVVTAYNSYYVPNTTDKINIGWAGTNTHLDDLYQASDAIIAIAKKYPNVKFKFFGYITPRLYKGLPGGSYEVISGVEIVKYHKMLGNLSLDIGLAPLKENEFNRGKSNLKVLEYGIMGVPTIATNIYPYSHTIEDGKDGLLVKNKYKKWYNALEKLILDVNLRKSMGGTIKEKIKTKYDMYKNVNLWEDAYFN